MLPRRSARPTNLTSVLLANDQDSKIGVGGQVIRCTAAAALLLGDVVYFTSTEENVNKSATASNYTAFAGVVVGGANTYGEAVYDSTVYGSLVAADANEEVLVQITGVAYAVAGVALATIGATVDASAVTAGRLAAAGVTDGLHLGILLQAAAGAASVVKIKLAHR